MRRRAYWLTSLVPFCSMREKRRSVLRVYKVQTIQSMRSTDASSSAPRVWNDSSASESENEDEEWLGAYSHSSAELRSPVATSTNTSSGESLEARTRTPRRAEDSRSLGISSTRVCPMPHERGDSCPVGARMQARMRDRGEAEAKVLVLLICGMSRQTARLSPDALSRANRRAMPGEGEWPVRRAEVTVRCWLSAACMRLGHFLCWF